MSVLLVTHLLELIDIYVLLIVQLLEAFVGLPLSSQLGTQHSYSRLFLFCNATFTNQFGLHGTQMASVDLTLGVATLLILTRNRTRHVHLSRSGGNSGAILLLDGCLLCRRPWLSW